MNEISDSPELETNQQAQQKKTRKSRKSITTRIEETLLQIDADIKAGDNKPSRSNLLQSKLDTLRLLLTRQDSLAKDAVLLENEKLKAVCEAFAALAVTPESVAVLRDEHNINATRLETLRVNAKNDAAEIERQRRELECLKKNLVFAAQNVTDPLFPMRSFLALKSETRDELLGGIAVRDWLQCELALSTREKMLTYLREHRGKPNCEFQICYCSARLQVEHDLSPQDIDKIFAEDDAQRERQEREDYQKFLEEEAQKQKAEAMLAPRGIGGSTTGWAPEWLQPVPRTFERTHSGATDLFSPWV